MENFRLKVFRAVARHCNFRIAAEDLLLSQPAVTQQIKSLESELNTPLFNRTGSRTTLTDAGQVLLPFAEQLAVLANEAQQAVSATTSSIAGTLHLAASQTISQYLLPNLIAAFLTQHPAVQLSVVSGNTQTVLEALAAHRVSLALIEGPALRQDVRLEPFMEDHMVCVVPAGHEWAAEEITLAQLQHATFVTRELGSGSRRIVEQNLEKAGLLLSDVRIRMTFDTTEGLLSAVEAGLGIAFVSRWAVRPRLALGTVALVRIRGLHLKRTFSLATLSGPQPVGLTGAFLRFVLDRAEGLAPRPSGRIRSQ